MEDDRNPPVTVGFPSQRPVTRSFDVFFDLRLNKRLSKQSKRRWFETPSRSSLRNCNGDLDGDPSPLEHLFLVWFLTHPENFIEICSHIVIVAQGPSGTKPLLEAILTYHQHDLLVSIPWKRLFGHSVYRYTRFMKFTRLKFVKGSQYISGAQSTKLWSGLVVCLQMPWFLTPPEHQWTSCCLCMCILQIRSFNKLLV